jgi:2,4-dienoyl-CoA reductase-like NADH-dependent reductase (Old Yellow Enzyme family)/pyruvate/2-oxoglutarate dehydrogenase complex dihydrolipoamide dehydrogenase (E3) component
MFKAIFQPGMIGNLEIKNRLIVPAMLTEFADANGRLTERYIRYYEEKARGGWGLIIVEDNVIEPRGAGFKCVPGVWADEMMVEHKELTDRVHAAGAKIALQVYHAGRQTHSSVTGELPVAPSPIQDPILPETPRELETDEVKELVEKFAQAVRRVKDAGYDAVELHGAHGYLINQFVSPFSNKRTDQYGGNFNNRMRFPLEIIQRAKELVGHDYPITYRISAEELVEGGLTIEDTKVISMELEDAGIAAIHASGGVYKSNAALCATTTMQTAAFSDFAKQIKRVVTIPVITVNKIVYPEVAESLLREGKADFVAMGRASIADPHLPNKTKAGKMDEILHCIGCRQGCWSHLLMNKPISCLVNPLTGKEHAYAITPVDTPKKVMVVGGGPVGMEAAIVASKRGHAVTLYEKGDRLGGQWLQAAVPPGKELLNSLTVWQKGELERSGTTIALNQPVNAALIEQEQPDHIIVATGSTAVVPSIPGIDKPHVHMVEEILRGKLDMAGQVVVIGGGLVGVETAQHIAVHNQTVTIVEMQSELATDMEGGARHFMLESLKANDVASHIDSTVVEIRDNSVVIETGGERQEIPADQVIVAVGSKSNTQLLEEIGDRIPTIVLGDAMLVGKALEGINNAYAQALTI